MLRFVLPLAGFFLVASSLADDAADDAPSVVLDAR